MVLRYFQKGFNYSQDGPGNRLVYHLQGCNLHCPWCANPEGMSLTPPLMQKASPLPDFVCPFGAVTGDGQLERSHCHDCTEQACLTSRRSTYLVCPTKEVPVEAVFAEIQSCRSMFTDGGGVTFTGGEATLQLDALLELLPMLREAGIHTAVETNATHPRLPELLPYLSLYIGDFKHYDADKLHQVTGGNLAQIQKNLNAVAATQIPMLVRILLVHHFNDAPSDIDGFLQALKPLREANPNLSVEFLTYHEYGKVKWEQCGMPYTMEDAFIQPETVAAFTRAFREAGIPVVRT